MQAVNRNPSSPQVRKFGLTMLGGFAVIGGLLWWRGRMPDTGWGYAATGLQQTALVLWALGLCLTTICSLSHVLGKHVYVGWMTAAMYLGIVMSTLMLSLLYFVLLPVFSLIRLKDPLRMKLKTGGSYWEPHMPADTSLERMRRPF